MHETYIRAHIGPESFLAGTNNSSLLRVDYNKFEHRSFFEQGDLTGGSFNIIYNKRISKNNIHARSTMLKFCWGAHQAGQPFHVICDLPKHYKVTQDSAEEFVVSNLKCEYLKLLIENNSAHTDIIRKDMNFVKFCMKQKIHVPLKAAHFDTVVVKLGFKRGLNIISGEGELEFSDLDHWAELEPLGQMKVYPRDLRSSNVQCHFKSEIKISQMLSDEVYRPKSTKGYLQVCRENNKMFKVSDSVVHMGQNRLISGLIPQMKVNKNLPSPRLIHDRHEYMREVHKIEKTFKDFSNRRCENCNRSGHDTKSCWMIWEPPSESTPEMKKIFRTIDLFPVKRFTRLREDGRVPSLAQWKKFESDFLAQKHRFTKFVFTSFDIDINSTELRAIPFGYGLNKKNWIALLLLGAPKTLVKRAFAGFRVVFHKNAFGKDILPPPLIFINKIDNEDTQKTFEETQQDCLDGKFVPIPFDPQTNKFVQNGSLAFRIKEMKPNNVIKYRPICAAMSANAGQFSATQSLPNEREIDTFIERDACYMECDARGCFEQIPARAQMMGNFAVVFQKKNGKYVAFVPTGNPQGGRQSSHNACSIISVVREGFTALGFPAKSYVDDLNIKVSNGLSVPDCDRESVPNLREKTTLIKTWIERNVFLHAP